MEHIANVVEWPDLMPPSIHRAETLCAPLMRAIWTFDVDAMPFIKSLLKWLVNSLTVRANEEGVRDFILQLSRSERHLLFQHRETIKLGFLAIAFIDMQVHVDHAFAAEPLARFLAIHGNGSYVFRVREAANGTS